MAAQLTTALPHFAEVLQTSLSAMAQLSPQSPPKLHHNIKWSRLHLNAIPTGTTDTQGAYTSAEVHVALAAENSAYHSLTITQQPSWVCDLTTYKTGSASSLSFSFEDLDSSSAQHLLCLCTMFAFGHIITVKHWMEKLPQKRPSKTPTKMPPTPQAQGHNTPAGMSQPSAYTHDQMLATTQQPDPAWFEVVKACRAKKHAIWPQHQGGPD
jgi:hypothetical protein